MMSSSVAPLPDAPVRVCCFPGCSHPGSMRLAASPSSLSPPASCLLFFVSFPIRSLLLFLFSSPFLSAAVSFSSCCPGRSNVRPLRPRTLQSRASAPRMFQSWGSSCLGCSSPWHRVHPRTIQSGGSGRAPVRPGSSNPGRYFIVFPPLPRMFQSVAPCSSPDDPVRELGPCSNPPRMLQSGASYYLTLSVASDAPVRGTWFTPDDPVRGLGPCSDPPRMLQSAAS